MHTFDTVIIRLKKLTEKKREALFPVIQEQALAWAVARVEADRFSVSLIPHTAAVTLLGQRRTGDRVNLESDLVGKYVERLLRPAPEEKGQSRLTMEFLTQHGF